MSAPAPRRAYDLANDLSVALARIKSLSAAATLIAAGNGAGSAQERDEIVTHLTEVILQISCSALPLADELIG